ncbi:hypothetical protein GXP67_22165 [Rhodocytophaga rosea]|uniref:Uncharacterized protein n=1 Tax=Rhodocytophaga rosea TaxID=2704465 RepID=A0A6C0GNE8_9BACT|nr:hypothetical protein [Rhodocytophaga rosea]QHT69153.1 hypothetical protein GXP67_22165 [Rhodocytophaga rosea]
MNLARVRWMVQQQCGRFWPVGKPEVCAMILSGVKQALLVLPQLCWFSSHSHARESFVTFLLGMQKKSKTAQVSKSAYLPESNIL